MICAGDFLAISLSRAFVLHLWDFHAFVKGANEPKARGVLSSREFLMQYVRLMYYCGLFIKHFHLKSRYTTTSALSEQFCVVHVIADNVVFRDVRRQCTDFL